MALFVCATAARARARGREMLNPKIYGDYQKWLTKAQDEGDMELSYTEWLEFELEVAWRTLICFTPRETVTAHHDHDTAAH